MERRRYEEEIEGQLAWGMKTDGNEHSLETKEREVEKGVVGLNWR